MPLTSVDSDLLQRCLRRDRGAWNDFVDRFLGLIYHVIRHTSYLRSQPLTPEDTEDIAADILVRLVADNYHVLRQFRGKSSLATYLTVVARRICVHELARKMAKRDAEQRDGPTTARYDRPKVGNLEAIEEVQDLLKQLSKREREVVRMFYLEHRTYEEISTRLKLPINTIGPILSRARKRLRGAAAKD